MAAPKSSIDARGYTTIPESICRVLGVGPGSAIEWYEENGEICVRRVDGNAERPKVERNSKNP